MATLQTKSFTQFLSDQAAAIQGAAAGLIDFTVGSILRAFAQSIAQGAMWLQGMILVLLQTTRLATSSGADVDSFVGDFGLTRLQAQAATGSVTFSRFSTVGQAVVPVGSTVETADGSQQYAVTVDTTNGAYNASLAGYVMAATVGSVSVPVQASVAGSAGNAAANAITTVTSSIPGVDTVTNAAAFTSGVDAESDAALKIRFVAYLQSLEAGTLGAVQFAIKSVQQGVADTVTENAYYDGTPSVGHFSIVADDGSGDPPSPFLDAVYAAVDAVRPIGSTFEVHGPIDVTAVISMLISVASSYNATTVAGLAQAAIVAYVNALPVGTGLAWSRLIQIAYDASPGVTDVSAVLLNSGTSDIAGAATTVIRTTNGSVTVSHA